ncbi:2TM domain-containing protein [Flavobacterium sp.]|uniref:2TM domain-containing protein n=1 Tax=Flavobacterium sp. TaxID=239 RepID=UPI0039E35EE9
MENLDNIEQLRMERARKRVKAMMGFYKHLMVYVVVNAVLLAIKYFNLDPGETFFELGNFSTAFFWGIGLVFHAMSVFGTHAFLGSDWEERKIRQIMEKEKQSTSKWE